MAFPITFFLTAALVLAGAASAAPQAPMPLDSGASELHFVSVKEEHLAERHRFQKLSGRLYPSGRAVVTVDLSSVATGVAIRDQRMRDRLFQVDSQRRARLETKVALDELDQLAVGESVRRELTAELTLNGHTREIRAQTLVVRRPEGGFLVASRGPVLLDARDFGLASGVTALSRMAGLGHISYAVPVSFLLAFEAPS